MMSFLYSHQQNKTVEYVNNGSTDFRQWEVEINLGRSCKAYHNLEVKYVGLRRGGSLVELDARVRSDCHFLLT